MSNENIDLPLVHVSCRRAGRRVDPRTVRRRAIRVLRTLEADATELSVLLTDDPTIHELNRDYRGVDQPTDVLAFPQDSTGIGPTPHLLGDVVISVDTAARQAEQGCRKLVEEITVLLIHGVLHLLGHDHHTAPQRRRMAGESARLHKLFEIDVSYL